MTPSRYPPYPDYRDSGVDWLGEIPSHWEVVRFDSVLPERDEKNRDLQESNILSLLKDVGVIRYEDKGNIGNKSSDNPANYKLVYPNDLVMNSMNLFMGSVGISREAGVTSSVYIICRAKDETVDIEYFHNLIRDRGFQQYIGSLGKGIMTIREAVNWRDLKAQCVPKPPPLEQHAIAEFLDREIARLDALIDAKRRLIELLKEKRAALISHVVTKGLDPDVPMKDSGIEWIGKIPSHWSVMRLAMASKKITNGFVGPTRDIYVQSSEEAIRYIQSLHIKNGRIIFNEHHNKYYVSHEWSLNHKKSILQEGDVLIVQTGACTGECATVTKEYEESNCHALIVVQFRDGFGSGYYLSALLRSNYGLNALRVSTTGALHPHLECGKVREIKIVLPPIEEQDLIMESANIVALQYDRLTSNIETAIDALQEYRTALIAAAVTGKIDVRGEVSSNGTTESSSTILSS